MHRPNNYKNPYEPIGADLKKMGNEIAYESGWDACIAYLKSQEHADWLATEEGQNSKGEWYFIPEE